MLTDLMKLKRPGTCIYIYMYMYMYVYTYTYTYALFSPTS